MSLDEISAAYKFDHLHGISQIRYDVEKLTWMNHKWIASYDTAKLTELCKPFLVKNYDLSHTSDQTLQTLIKSIQNDLHTLAESIDLLKFYFIKPAIVPESFSDVVSATNFATIQNLLKDEPISDWNSFLNSMKLKIKTAGIADKLLYAVLRILLTGSPKGMQLNDLLSCLGEKEFFARLKK
jgi:glutamyl/glutaminyl-tRNA synthetase